MSTVPQLFYLENLCTRCYRCVEACPNKATIKTPDGAIKIDRSLCKACGKCVEACPNKAREISGKLMTVDEVLEEVKKDALFYQNSGGGVTFSGGEPPSSRNSSGIFSRGVRKAAFRLLSIPPGSSSPRF